MRITRIRASTLLLIVALVAPSLTSSGARAQAVVLAGSSAEGTCPQQHVVKLEQQALALRTESLDAEIDRWPLTLPIVGLAASALAFGTLAYAAQHGNHPSLTWGLNAIPAAGAISALGFIIHRAVKRHPFTSERTRIARRQSELQARDFMLARSQCGDEATVTRAAHASIVRIDGQLAHIRKRSEAVSLTAPVTLIVTGTLIAGGFGFATLIDWLVTTPLSNNAQELNRPRLIGLGIGALSGVALAASGIAWTVKRGRERKDIEREAQPLNQHKRGLELLLSPSASTSQAGLALNGRF